MSTRRLFLKNSLLSAGGLLINPAIEETTHFSKKDSPIVLATWDRHKAAEVAWQIINSGGYALDAVEKGVRVQEADPNDTSVGLGGLPDRDGFVTLDACIMDEKGKAGSVCFLQNIMHPISVARKVMENTPHVILSGEGAYQFARKQGFPHENLLTEESKAAWEKWKLKSKYETEINRERHDTIGMLAVDKNNRISGACTTSGMGFKMHGRVGDSPIIGAGMFVDNEVGGAAATGVGEFVLRTLGSFLVVEEMRRGASPQKAVEIAIKRIKQKHGAETSEAQVGFIAIDKKGRYGAFSIHEGFNYALFKNDKNGIFNAKYSI